MRLEETGMRNLAVACLTGLMVAPLLADRGELVKWDQLGPGSGWGGASFACYDTPNNAVTADDFFCDGTLPIITGIEFYGWSYYGEANYVDGFRISFWTDVPGTSEDDGHPGDLLYQAEVGYEYLGENHFKIDLPEELWFYQGSEEQILWISIQGVMTTDDIPDAFYWEFLEPGHGWGDGAAFTSDYWNYPPWYNWGWMTPDAPTVYEGAFPDGWYASADMRFLLTGVPEPASICLFGLCLVLLHRR
jgi:hypothetical protein